MNLISDWWNNNLQSRIRIVKLHQETLRSKLSVFFWLLSLTSIVLPSNLCLYLSWGYGLILWALSPFSLWKALCYKGFSIRTATGGMARSILLKHGVFERKQFYLCNAWLHFHIKFKPNCPCRPSASCLVISRKTHDWLEDPEHLRELKT